MVAKHCCRRLLGDIATKKMKKATAALLPSPCTLEEEEEEEGDGSFVMLPSLLCCNKTNKKNA
jgi:hypothetical protein